MGLDFFNRGFLLAFKKSNNYTIRTAGSKVGRVNTDHDGPCNLSKVTFEFTGDLNRGTY